MNVQQMWMLSLLLLVASATAFSPSPKNSVPPSPTTGMTHLDAVTVRAPMTPPAAVAPPKPQDDDTPQQQRQYAKSFVIDSTKLRRSKWGVDNQHEEEYWFNDQVSFRFSSEE